MDHKRLNLFFTKLCSKPGDSLSITGLSQPSLSAGYRRSPSSLGLAVMCVCGEDIPGLTNLLFTGSCLHLWQIVESTGGDLQNAEALVSFLGVRSLRFTSRLLDKITYNTWVLD